MLLHVRKIGNAPLTILTKHPFRSQHHDAIGLLSPYVLSSLCEALFFVPETDAVPCSYFPEVFSAMPRYGHIVPK